VSAFGQVIALHLRSNLLDAEGTVYVPPSLVVADEEQQQQQQQQPQPPAGKRAKQQAKQPQHTVEIDYVHKLNQALPSGIRVHGWAPVPSSFNARFGCASRTYKYFFLRGSLDIAVRTA